MDWECFCLIKAWGCVSGRFWSVVIVVLRCAMARGGVVVEKKFWQWRFLISMVWMFGLQRRGLPS